MESLFFGKKPEDVVVVAPVPPAAPATPAAPAAAKKSEEVVAVPVVAGKKSVDHEASLQALMKKNEKAEAALQALIKKNEKAEVALQALVKTNFIQECQIKKYSDFLKQSIRQGSVVYDLSSCVVYLDAFNKEEPTKYAECEVYGSWDSWQTPSTVSVKEFVTVMSWVIEIPSVSPGINTYKIKKGGEWIEPTEPKIKDAAGIWNNVFVV